MSGYKFFSKKHILYFFLVVFLSCSVGFCAGYYLKPKVVASSTVSIRENTDEYNFIHPLLAVNRKDDTVPSANYVSLYKNIEKYIASQKKDGTVVDTSVYFMDYKNGGMFTINPDDRYHPASMLKVVIMIGYLKEADDDSTILNEKLTYAPSIAQKIDDAPFEDGTKLISGHTYSVNDLINKMIIDSDNGAMNLLLEHIDNDYLNKIYSEIGLKNPDSDTYTISPEDFVLFFRILYNATYLSNDNSEKALSILSQAKFSDGLVAGLPSNIIVSHKYGERIIGSGDQIQSVELHDCGIVYPDQGPYLLCVMTQGKNLSSLQNTISTISKMVYENSLPKTSQVSMVWSFIKNLF